MIYQSYEAIVSRIVEATSIPKQEIEIKIQQKLNELQDLISKQGAAHIVANDLGVKLFDSTPKTMKIGNITPGLQAITITAKVIENYGAKSFQSANRQGRVLSMLIGDETGTIRASIWDENVIAQAQNAKKDDIVKIQNAYSKQNNQNPMYKDLHLGNRSQITINPVGEVVETVKAGVKPPLQKKQILDLAEGEFIEISGIIVQVFEPRSYNACPVCNKRAVLEADSFVCAEHGKIVPKQVPILNLFVDDGSSNIRSIFFREHAEKLLGNNTANFEELKKDLLGKQLILKGKVTLNQMFNRLEFMVAGVEEAVPSKMITDIETVKEN